MSEKKKPATPQVKIQLGTVAKVSPLPPKRTPKPDKPRLIQL